MLRTIILALAVVSFLTSRPAQAIMATESEMELADLATFNQIVTTPGGKDFVGSAGKVFARRWGWKDDFIVARVENDICDGEYCLTAFISDRGADSRIIGLGMLAGKLTFGDVLYDWCKVCGNSYAVSFVDSRGKWTTLGISREYIVIVGNSKD